jgi:hypothetical protein
VLVIRCRPNLVQAALAEVAEEEQSRLDRERTATAASERYRRRLRGVPMLAGIMPMSLPPIPRSSAASTGNASPASRLS